MIIPGIRKTTLGWSTIHFSKNQLFCPSYLSLNKVPIVGFIGNDELLGYSAAFATEQRLTVSSRPVSFLSSSLRRSGSPGSSHLPRG
jgi:hypothetical protein